MASYILYEQKRKIGEKKESIIAAAAKLIKDEQRDLEKMNKAYPHLINCLTLVIIEVMGTSKPAVVAKLSDTF